MGGQYGAEWSHLLSSLMIWMWSLSPTHWMRDLIPTSCPLSSACGLRHMCSSTCGINQWIHRKKSSWELAYSTLLLKKRLTKWIKSYFITDDKRTTLTEQPCLCCMWRMWSKESLSISVILSGKCFNSSDYMHSNGS